jgi:hypothetical protein
MRRNSITPSRAFLTKADLVETVGGSPFGPGRQSRTPQAHEATGFGEPFSSTRHIRQLPAIDSVRWKQNRGISAPASSQACSNVNSGGTSASIPSTMSLVISCLSMSADEIEPACQCRCEGYFSAPAVIRGSLGMAGYSAAMSTGSEYGLLE